MTVNPGVEHAKEEPAGKWVGKVSGTKCVQSYTPPVLSAAVDTAGAIVQSATDPTTQQAAPAAPQLIQIGLVANSVEGKAEQARRDKAAADKKAADDAAAKAAAAAAAKQQPAALAGAPVGPALGAPAPLAAAGPVGGLPALPALPPLAGVAPAGLASSLFGANAYDPGLLMGSPLGNAASALFNPQADSAVTTVSQAQALAGTDSGGYGTPVTIGVIILACLIGFAVRHRVISRMKARELPAAEYEPRHAAPESLPEPAPEPVTDLHPAADDAKTLVVLTRR